jgi:hypothetical protein
MYNQIDVQDNPPEETAENNTPFRGRWKADRNLEFGKSMKMNFVIKIRQNLRTSSHHGVLAAIPNGFENRASRTELVDLLLSEWPIKVDSI